MTAHLEQEIQNLESTLGVLAHRIQVLYSEYAQVVALAARKQLILAAFNICTHYYPGEFLRLNSSDRQLLQSGIVAIADRLQARMVEYLRANLVEHDPEEIDRSLNQILEEFAHQANLLLEQNQILKLTQEPTPRIILRLPEIEFTDRTVMSQRGELRVLFNRREQLKQELEKKRQLKLTLDAEEAWRSTWTESL